MGVKIQSMETGVDRLRATCARKTDSWVHNQTRAGWDPGHAAEGTSPFPKAAWYSHLQPLLLWSPVPLGSPAWVLLEIIAGVCTQSEAFTVYGLCDLDYKTQPFGGYFYV